MHSDPSVPESPVSVALCSLLFFRFFFGLDPEGYGGDVGLEVECDLDEIIPTTVTRSMYNAETKPFTATCCDARINLTLTVY